MPVVSLEIGGNDKQEEREGYNKIEVNTNNYTVNGITVTNNNDGSLTLNGTNADKVTYIQINATGSALKNNYFDLVNGDNYYLYAGAVMNGNMGLYIRSDSDFNYSLSVSGSGIGKVITWGGQTCENGFAFLRIGENVTLNNLTIRPMLAKSDVELEYEAYGAMPSPSYPSEVETVSGQANVVVSNKNILNFEEKSTSWNGSTITVAGNKIKFVGSETGGSDLSYSSNRQKVDLRKGTTITYSSKYVSGVLTSGNTYYHLYGVNKDGISTKLIDLKRDKEGEYKNDRQATYTLQEDIKEIYISGSSYLIEGLTELIYEFQLEIGDTATDIIEHAEQTKVVDIQQEMLQGDYFVKEADGWKEVHLWNKLIFTGAENWFKSGASTSEIFAAAIDIENAVVGYGYSNYFKYYGKTAIGYFSVYNNGTNIRFCIDSLVITDLNSFKTWLAQKHTEGNPVYVWYKLATPTKLTCTEKQSAQLDDLLNTSTYKNVTHIYSTDKVSPIIKIKYRKDIETMLNNQQSEYETRLSNIEKLLYTTTTSALLLDNLQTDLEKEVL